MEEAYNPMFYIYEISFATVVDFISLILCFFFFCICFGSMDDDGHGREAAHCILKEIGESFPFEIWECDCVYMSIKCRRSASHNSVSSRGRKRAQQTQPAQERDRTGKEEGGNRLDSDVDSWGNG